MMQLYSLSTVVREDEHGHRHIGIYWIWDGMVHVSYLGSSPCEATQLGGSSAEVLAQMILTEFMTV